MPSVRVSVSGSASGDSSSIADSAPDQPRICFTRQLWQRTMPTDAEDAGHSSNYRGQRVSIGSSTTLVGSASAIDTNTRHHISPVRSSISDTPLTPEESPPFKNARKRSAAYLYDANDDDSPSHSRDGSDGSFQPCLCQPEPKVPRPRNGM